MNRRILLSPGFGECPKLNQCSVEVIVPFTRTVDNACLSRLERPAARIAQGSNSARLCIFWEWYIRLGDCMVDSLLAAAADAAEAQGGGENWAASLSRLHGPGHEASAIAHPFDVI